MTTDVMPFNSDMHLVWAIGNVARIFSLCDLLQCTLGVGNVSKHVIIRHLPVRTGQLILTMQQTLQAW